MPWRVRRLQTSRVTKEYYEGLPEALGYATSLASYGLGLDVLNHSSKLLEPMRGFAPGVSD
jgi:hypothetical protein